MRENIRLFFFRFKDGLAFTLPMVLITGLVMIFWGNEPLLQLLDGSFFKSGIGLQFPVYADLDAKDNLYVIDKNSRRILSIAPGGQLRWSLSGGQRSRGIYETYRLAAVAEGGVCVYNAVLDPLDATLESEEILLFDDRGDFVDTLVRKFYPRDQRGQDDQRIGSLSVKQGFLHYFYKDGERMKLLRRPLGQKGLSSDPQAHEEVFSARIPVDYVAAADGRSGFFLAERRGGFFFLDKSGVLSVPAFALDAGVPVFEKPWDVKLSPDGAVYVLDNLRQVVYKAPPSSLGAAFPVFDTNRVLALGQKKPFFEAVAVGSSGTLAVVDKFNHSVFLVTGAERVRVVSGAEKTLRETLSSQVLLFNDLLFFPLALFVLIGLGRRLFARRTSLMIKQIALFLPVVTLSVALGSSGIKQLLDASYRKELTTKLALMASLGARLIDGDLVSGITKASDYDGPAHRKLGEQVSRVMSGYAQPWSQDLRAVVYKYSQDTFYFVKNYSSYYGVMFPYGGATREHFASARGGTNETTVYSDEYGAYISGLSPVKTSSGEISGVLEIYHNYSTVEELAAEFGRNLLSGIILSVTTVIVLLAGANILLFLSLSVLRRASARLSQGEIGITVQINRRDEIQDLAQDFNSMSGQLKETFGRLRAIRDANARFVPTEFISYLKKESIAEVESGHQTRETVTLFFADIRSFTTISEGLTPKENFDFVNSYLSLMGPVIRAHGGFIDRYLGDAIMALFPGSPERAVRAGLEMREKLADFNAEREASGLKPIDFGVGVHTEEIILGVVGEKNRLSVTVVSEAVDLVNQLEAATKSYGVGMVMTEAVWRQLSQEFQARARAFEKIKYQDNQLQLYGM